MSETPSHPLSLSIPATNLSATFRDSLAEQKSNFLATISHELRTPMQSVYGLLELMQQQGTDPIMQDMIRSAQNSASLMLDLLDDILDFARLDANRLELEDLEIPVRTLVQGVTEALQIRIGDRDIDLNAVIDENVPPIIMGDPKRLRQILFNLVANALKFTTKGHVSLHVGVEATAPHFMLRFSIVDTGIGIEESAQKRLFQPFMQADNTTARRFGGTGLGLSICKKLVDLMHGTIGVQSQIDQGSTFWFTLPCRIAETTMVPPSLDLSGLVILVVEDHPQAAQEIDRSLRQMRADVQVVETIADAHTLLTRQRFDVAVIDYALPDGYGTELARAMAHNHPRTGLILYTVHDHDGLQQELDTLGVTYLAKPASRQGLGQAILNVAQRQWRHREDIHQKILIAEDTESIRNMLQLQMNRLGVEVDLVSNGIEAIAKIETNPYGLVIADLHMPVMDGYKLIRRLREPTSSSKNLPVILMTADVQMAQRPMYTRFGFDDCLLKPVTLNHIRRTLERWGIQASAPFSYATPPEVTDLDNQNLSLINLNQLMSNMGATQEEALALLYRFPDMCHPLLTRIDIAAKAHDLRELSEAAHSLKGAARSTCCEPLGNAAALLQDTVARRMPHESTLAAVHQMFSEACSEIKRLEQTIQKNKRIL